MIREYKDKSLNDLIYEMSYYQYIISFIHMKSTYEKLFFNNLRQIQIRYNYYRIIDGNEILMRTNYSDTDHNILKNCYILHAYYDLSDILYDCPITCMQLKIIIEHKGIKKLYNLGDFNFDIDFKYAIKDIVADSDPTLDEVQSVKNIFNSYTDKGYICISYKNFIDIVERITQKIDSWHGSGLD